MTSVHRRSYKQQVVWINKVSFTLIWRQSKVIFTSPLFRLWESVRPLSTVSNIQCWRISSFRALMCKPTESLKANRAEKQIPQENIVFYPLCAFVMIMNSRSWSSIYVLQLGSRLLLQIPVDQLSPYPSMTGLSIGLIHVVQKNEKHIYIPFHVKAAREEKKSNLTFSYQNINRETTDSRYLTSFLNQMSLTKSLL